MTPALATLFMVALEETMMAANPVTIPGKFWMWFLGGIFVLWTNTNQEQDWVWFLDDIFLIWTNTNQELDWVWFLKDIFLLWTNTN